jgi:hypothetical protein
MNDTYIRLYMFVWEICTPQNYDHIVYWITLKFLDQWTIKKKYINNSINRHSQIQWHTRVYWQTNNDIPAEENRVIYLWIIYIYIYSN